MPTMTIYIGLIQREWQQEPEYCVHTTDMRDFYAREVDTFYHPLGEREIEVPEPLSRAEINGAMIESLEVRKAAIQDEARAKVKAIEERIANLICLDHLDLEDSGDD